jgi:uncharacterized protein (DUF1501 family)
MTFTRRDFLRTGLGSSTLLACGAAVPTFLARSALAFDRAKAAAGRVLVVLELSGGNDGLNTVVPYDDDEYRKHRRTTAVAANEVIKVDDRVGLHPSLGGLAKLLERNELAVVQGAGYPNPNFSHFESAAIWHTARMNPARGEPGWLGRYLGTLGATTGDTPAVHVCRAALPQALTGKDLQVPTVTDAEQVRRRLGFAAGGAAREHLAALDRVAGLPRAGADSDLQFIRRSSLMTYASAARLEAVLQKAGPAGARYPAGELGRQLGLVAQLIKAGLTTSLYYTQLGGFDTHANQLATHPALLRQVGDALHGFLEDLRPAGDAKRVLVLVFSEFGRRPAETAGGGTDHGTAAPVFLAGPAVKAGLHGSHPDLADLLDGNLKSGIDFRRVYAAVLRWLGCPMARVLPEKFEPWPVIRDMPAD